jgi:hypothetical protein
MLFPQTESPLKGKASNLQRAVTAYQALTAKQISESGYSSCLKTTEVAISIFADALALFKSSEARM